MILRSSSPHHQGENCRVPGEGAGGAEEEGGGGEERPGRGSSGARGDRARAAYGGSGEN